MGSCLRTSSTPRRDISPPEGPRSFRAAARGRKPPLSFVASISVMRPHCEGPILRHWRTLVAFTVRAHRVLPPGADCGSEVKHSCWVPEESAPAHGVAPPHAVNQLIHRGSQVTGAVLRAPICRKTISQCDFVHRSDPSARLKKLALMFGCGAKQARTTQHLRRRERAEQPSLLNPLHVPQRAIH